MKAYCIGLLCLTAISTAAYADCGGEGPHRQFDFWLGHWQVVDAEGQPQGRNHISTAEQGCLLLERWQGVQGGTGQSMNYYDPHAQQWIQRWVSPTVLINLIGSLADGEMRLLGDIYYYRERTFAPFRGTWTPLGDGRVRQFFEQYDESAATWQPWFEGFYQRVADD